MLKIIMQPSREPYWKTSYKGGCQDIFFVTTLDRTLGFMSEMDAAAEKSGYPASDIGVYIQPRHQGVNCHCEFSLPYNPDNTEELSRIKTLYKEASEALMEKGALFTRPYGIWADMAYKKDIVSTNMLKSIKDIFDPNGVMNPGKLCFEMK
jgi:FAD/FMN-containing dehydrogenase